MDTIDQLRTDLDALRARIEAVLNLAGEAEKPQEEWPYTWTDEEGDARRASANRSTEQYRQTYGKWCDTDPSSFRAGYDYGLAAGRADGYEAKYQALCEAIEEAVGVFPLWAWNISPNGVELPLTLRDKAWLCAGIEHILALAREGRE